MSIIILFHRSNYKDFKNFYLFYMHKHLKKAFPKLLSYSRFLEVMPRVLVPLCGYFTHLKGKPTGISFVDSTSLKVCHNLRIPRHKVFEGIAARGKGTMGWFYGFKLHRIINHLGDILAVKLTPGNVDDRKPVPELTNNVFGKLYGDKGYISKALAGTLFEKGEFGLNIIDIVFDCATRINLFVGVFGSLMFILIKQCPVTVGVLTKITVVQIFYELINFYNQVLCSLRLFVRGLVFFLILLIQVDVYVLNQYQMKIQTL